MSAAGRLQGAHPPASKAEQLFQEHSASLYRYCRRRLGSPEDAEDAVQVIYLNAWQSLRRGIKPDEPRSWLFAIAANVCSTTLRARLRGARVEVRDPEHFERLPSAGAPAEELVDLDAALEALPTRQRQALVLRDWRGLSYEEIATKLDASQPAVETLLFRARRAVVVSLATPARRIRRVPLRSALSAFLPWPLGFSGLKSSFASSSASAKVALGIAAGATAPLVAFGVFESIVMNRDAPPTPRSPAVESRFDVPRAVWGPVPPSAEDTSRSDEGAGKSKPPKPAAALTPPTSGAGGVGPASAGSGSQAPGAGGEASAGVATASPEPSQSPSPAGEAPAEVPAANGLVVICHRTGSGKNPAVTISVDAAAVESLLGLGDQLGACAG